MSAIPQPFPRALLDGGTAKQRADKFVKVDMSGVAEVIKKLEAIKNNLEPKRLRSLIRSAANPIRKSYKQKAEKARVTGNLAKSVRTKTKEYPGAIVAICGPTHTGNKGASESTGSGNHSWLFEFGTGPRQPGTNNRRKYINVHQMVNGRMRSNEAMHDDDFRKAGAGYYFLMSSFKRPDRQNISTYPGNFLPDGKGGTRPYTLKSGATYGAMPASHAMENTIRSEHKACLKIIERQVARIIKKGSS